jgi:hypothetical protein
VLALLQLLPELRVALRPKRQLLLLQQLQAISRSLLEQGDVDEARADTLLLYYGFLTDSVAAGDAAEAKHDMKNLLAEGSTGLAPAAQQLQQQGPGAGGAQQQHQQQGGSGLLVGFELQCIGYPDSPPSKVALNLSRQLRRLFDRLGGGAAHSQQQQQQGAGLLVPKEAKPKLVKVCKALLASLQGAGGAGGIKLQVLVGYGFLQAWVVQRDVGQVQQALAALLSAADTGL